MGRRMMQWTDPSVRTAEERDRDLDQLHATWADPPGLMGWLTTVDHKRVGRRYIATSMVYFVLAGIAALLMRIQLSEPNRHFLGPDRYDQMVAMHGSAMLYLFAVPMMEAVAIFVLPLMLGARNISFPRLNAFGYWVYLFGGILVVLASLFDIAPATGFGAQMIAFTEVGTLCVAVAMVATILSMRAPGMTMGRIPLFAWSILVVSVVMIVATPVAMLDSTFMATDRLFGTQFHTPGSDGNALPWQHLTWLFGHPELYVILILALGITSSIVQTFSRRPIVGYTVMVTALVATGLLAFGIWLQHLFASGPTTHGDALSATAGILIAIPVGVQIICWIATLWRGRPIIAVPLLFVLGFFALFVIGGITGMILAANPMHLQVRDTYLVVAHLHYVLIGSAVFPLMGALYYWFPKFTGKMLSESIGRLHFWLFFIGFNAAFFPMHLLGMMGMPRHAVTYRAGLGWDAPNMIASLGAWVIAMSVLVFLFNVYYGMSQGRPAGDNPWGAPDLEWSTRSPPPPYNFEHTSAVHSIDPLWPLDGAPLSVVRGLSRSEREALLTSSIDAVPVTRWAMPGPSIWPLLSALALTLLVVWTTFFSSWGLAWGVIPLAVTLVAWSWPRPLERDVGGAQ